jgi:GT2 family glycosyltransferase
MKGRVGLVTVLFNSAAVLPGFFESLVNQKFSDYWLFIIDNSLDDVSFEMAKNFIKIHNLNNVSIIKNNSNVGVATGNNQGIQLALNSDCEYVLLLNNDIEFKDPDLLLNMLSVADERQEKIVVPKIYFHDTGRIWCAGGDIKKARLLFIHRGEGQADLGQYDSDAYVNYSPSCFMLIHASVFANVGLMDDLYFVYYDDADFIYRTNVFGYKVYYWAGGSIRHKVSSSTGGGESLFSIYYSTRNRIYFARKNFRVLNKVFACSYILITRLIKLVGYDSERRRKILRAIADGMAMRLD